MRPWSRSSRKGMRRSRAWLTNLFGDDEAGANGKGARNGETDANVFILYHRQASQMWSGCWSVWDAITFECQACLVFSFWRSWYLVVWQPYFQGVWLCKSFGAQALVGIGFEKHSARCASGQIQGKCAWPGSPSLLFSRSVAGSHSYFVTYCDIW